MPQISVVIPAYNSDSTIRETIESVLAQTWKYLEVLVINDGSTDNTVEVVSSFNDPRIELYSYPNAGLSASRNRGIDRAKSEYISFIDADDLWHPQKLECQFNALQENPDARVVYSWTNFIGECGNFLHRGSHFTVNGDVLPYIFLFNFIENGSNCLICKQSLEVVGGFNETMKSAEDWDLWMRLAEKYPFVCVPQPHVLYRKLTYSLSTDVKRLETACVQAIANNVDRLPEHLKDLKYASLGNIYKYLLLKCFENSRQKNIGSKILEFWQKALANDPNLLKNKRLVLAIFLKGAILSILPTSEAQKWSDRVDRKIYPTKELHKFFRTQPF